MRRDLVLLARVVDVAGPRQSVEVAHVQRGQRHFETGVVRRTDVLQRRREPRTHGQQTREQQIMCVLIVVLDRSRQAAIVDAEIDTKIGLVSLFPREIRIRNRSWAVTAHARGAERIQLAAQRTLRLIRVDGRVARRSVAAAQFQLIEETAKRRMNGSSPSCHAAENDGNDAHLCPGARRLEPSERCV